MKPSRAAVVQHSRASLARQGDPKTLAPVLEKKREQLKSSVVNKQHALLWRYIPAKIQVLVCNIDALN